MDVPGAERGREVPQEDVNEYGQPRGVGVVAVVRVLVQREDRVVVDVDRAEQRRDDGAADRAARGRLGGVDARQGFREDRKERGAGHAENPHVPVEPRAEPPLVQLVRELRVERVVERDQGAHRLPAEREPKDRLDVVEQRREQ